MSNDHGVVASKSYGKGRKKTIDNSELQKSGMGIYKKTDSQLSGSSDIPTGALGSYRGQLQPSGPSSISDCIGE